MALDPRDETAHRLRRIETKVSRILTHLDIPEGTTMPIRVIPGTILSPVPKAHINGYDITLSALKRQLEEFPDLDLHKPIELWVSGERAAQVVFIGA